MRSSKLALLLLILSCAPAAAQDNIDVAREHYLRGTRAYDLGFYEDAIREYMAAYQAKDDPALLFNLAQANRLAGHTAEALRFYRIYLSKLPRASNRDDVLTKIAELRKAVEQQKKTQNSLPPDHILGPGLEAPAPAADAPPPSAAPVAPAATAPPAPPHLTPPPASDEHAAAATAPSSAHAHAARDKKIAGAVLAGAGVALAATGIAFLALARNASTELSNANAYDPALAAAGTRDQTLGIALVGVGAASALTGIVVGALGLVQGRSERGKVAVYSTIGAHSAAAALAVRF